ncbi:MAG: hypothetical protein MJZ24_05070 [Paludibacteraceae bacterium]|nr:hypothetical protein [Candidatus Physcocola equi]MCQ2234096.1 hypothetical protein [Paludibacteraceae bacterium]
MKAIKLIIAAALAAALFSACKSSTCPGYGGVQRNYGAAVEIENVDLV